MIDISESFFKAGFMKRARQTSGQWGSYPVEDPDCHSYLSLGLKQHQIARSCSIAQSTVSEYIAAAEGAGVGWPAVAEWDERRLEEALFPNRREAPSRRQYPPPDFAAIYQELQTDKHVTLQLLWEEYRQACPTGYRYSRFCDLYRAWLRDMVLRQQHRVGEKTFVDWAGDTVPVHDRHTGDVHQASIFVAVLGASSYTFAEACWTQALPEWIGAHIRKSMSENAVEANFWPKRRGKRPGGFGYSQPSKRPQFFAAPKRRLGLPILTPAPC